MRSAFLVGEEGGESEIEEGDAEIDAAAAATTGMAVESGEPGALAGGYWVRLCRPGGQYLGP